MKKVKLGPTKGGKILILERLIKKPFTTKYPAPRNIARIIDKIVPVFAGLMFKKNPRRIKIIVING